MDYLEILTAPISDDNVCGENLEDDASFQNFFFTAQGEPERFDGENTIEAEPPDWREIENQALEFTERTKDLKLISILAQSLVNTKGLVPFSACLKAIAILLDEQWETVFPLLDEDDNDPLERISALSNLNVPFVLNAVKSESIANVKGVGNITISELEKASANSDDAPLTKSQIKSIFREINLEEVQLLHNALAYSLESIQDINTCLIDNAGHQYTADFEKLTGLLKSMKDGIEEYADLESDDEDSSDSDDYDNGYEDDDEDSEYDDDSDNSSSRKRKAGGQMKGEIHSREDVERCLGLINKYYANYEPSSPIPVLVNRAKKLVHADFLAIVKDIYPDGLSAVQSLGGMSPDEEEQSKDEDDDW